MLAVKHSPRHTIPEVIQRLEYDCEVSSSVASKTPVHVLEDNNFWATRTNQCREIVEEPGLTAPESCSSTHSCKREILARKPCGPDLRFGDVSWIDTCHILQ